MYRQLSVLLVLMVLFSVPLATPAQAQIGRPPGGFIPPGRGGDNCGLLDHGGGGGLVAGPLDPGAPGPFDVGTVVYDLDEVDLPNGPEEGSETEAVVFYPRPLGCGPFPVVVMLHGQHASCISDNGGAIDQWPCDPVDTIDNYRGYDYLGERLASQGVVAVSISANSINANGSATGEPDLARAELIQHHLGILEQLNTTDKLVFGDLFVGHLDLGRVGTLGHSRGGEGVVLHAGLNADAGNPYGLAAVMTVAGTQTTDALVNGIPILTLHAYCDGDLEGLASTGYYDGARYNQPGDPAAKHHALVMGANHNFYNTRWDPAFFSPGSKDDWNDAWGTDDLYCNDAGRLGSVEQQGTLVATAGAFFRAYLQDRRNFLAFLKGDKPPPPSAMTDQIFMAYHPPDDPGLRLDINTLDAPGNDTVNTLGGFAGTASFLETELCDPFTTPNFGCLYDLGGFFADERVPHYLNDFHVVRQLRLAWDADTPRWENRIPAGHRDFSRYRVVQFRGFVDFTDPLNPADQPQDLSVELEDEAGRTARVAVGDHSRALFYPPSDLAPGEPGTSVPRAVLHTARVPLDAFDGVYLTAIRSVRLVFDRTESGAINVADLALADEAENLSPVVSCSVAEPSLDQPNQQFVNAGLDVSVNDPDASGIALVDIDVFSDEDDGAGLNPVSPDAINIADGTLELRAERDPGGDGRYYLVTARALDAEGATGFGCCTVIVPKGDDTAVNQAEEALARCPRFVAAGEGALAPPAGAFAIGE